MGIEFEITEVKVTRRQTKDGLSEKYIHIANSTDADETFVIKSNDELYTVGDIIEISSVSRQTKLGGN